MTDCDMMLKEINHALLVDDKAQILNAYNRFENSPCSKTIHVGGRTKMFKGGNPPPSDDLRDLKDETRKKLEQIQKALQRVVPTEPEPEPEPEGTYTLKDYVDALVASETAAVQLAESTDPAPTPAAGGALTLKYLRNLAKRLNVKNYSSMNKETLHKTLQRLHRKIKSQVQLQQIVS